MSLTEASSRDAWLINHPWCEFAVLLLILSFTQLPVRNYFNAQIVTTECVVAKINQGFYLYRPSKSGKMKRRSQQSQDLLDLMDLRWAFPARCPQKGIDVNGPNLGDACVDHQEFKLATKFSVRSHYTREKLKSRRTRKDDGLVCFEGNSNQPNVKLMSKYST